MVDKGIIRILDLLVLQKDDDGNIEDLEIDSGENLGEPRGLETHVAEILAADDVVHVAEAIENGSTARVIVWENVWAAPFVSAARRPAGSWSRPSGSRSRRSSPRSRRDEADMSGAWHAATSSTSRSTWRDRFPVAMTAAVAGTAAVARWRW